MLYLVRASVACLLTLLFVGCASEQITSFEKGRPIFAPEQYFTGHTHSWGIFENRSGQPTEVLHTDTHGYIDATGLHFEQDLTFERGKKQHRSWLVRRIDAHHYLATGTGIVGMARGEAYGNAFHLQFTLDAFPKNPLAHLEMSQWMYLQSDGITLVNSDTLTKAGVVVAHITEQFRKDH